MRPTAIVMLGVALAAMLLGGACDKAKSSEGVSVYTAADQGDLGSIRNAIKGGFTINTPDDKGRTVLHHAAAAGQTDLVESLLEDYAANRNAKDAEGKTALDLANDAGYGDIAQLLQSES